ncbi:MAG TPA: ADP-ribosylation family protein [Ktedonobacterales bacterium]
MTQEPDPDDLTQHSADQRYQHWRAAYQRWRQAQLPPADALARLRSDAREATTALEAPTRAWIERTYGLPMPAHLFTFWAFWRGLSPSEHQATKRFVFPAGLFDFFQEGGRERVPRAGLDHRLAWRHYLDPPEFLTILTGRMDGLHYGLWYDSPQALPSYVARYYSREPDAIRCNGRTVLEALSTHVERALRDWYPPANTQEAEGDLFPTWLVRDAIAEYETVDREARGSAPFDDFLHEASRQRLATCNEMGVVIPAPYDHSIPHSRDAIYDAIRSDAPEVAEWIMEAARACAQGQPAFALVLGHDLHWLSADREPREEAAWRLLTRAYEVLGYDALAAIATLHHQHRHLPSVNVY